MSWSLCIEAIPADKAEKYRVQHCFCWYQHCLPAKQQVPGSLASVTLSQNESFCRKTRCWGAQEYLWFSFFHLQKTLPSKPIWNHQLVEGCLSYEESFLKWQTTFVSLYRGKKKKKRISSPPKTTPVLKQSLRSQVKVTRGSATFFPSMVHRQPCTNRMMLSLTLLSLSPENEPFSLSSIHLKSTKLQWTQPLKMIKCATAQAMQTSDPVCYCPLVWTEGTCIFWGQQKTCTWVPSGRRVHQPLQDTLQKAQKATRNLRVQRNDRCINERLRK